MQYFTYYFPVHLNTKEFIAFCIEQNSKTQLYGKTSKEYFITEAICMQNAMDIQYIQVLYAYK